MVGGGLMLKLLVVLGAIVIAGGSGYVGYWIGELRGYGKGWAGHSEYVAENTRKKNAVITSEQSALDEAAKKADSLMEDHAAKAVTSLGDFPFKQRQECAQKCSIPKSARQNLEAIQ